MNITNEEIKNLRGDYSPYGIWINDTIQTLLKAVTERNEYIIKLEKVRTAVMHFTDRHDGTKVAEERYYLDLNKALFEVKHD